MFKEQLYSKVNELLAKISIETRKGNKTEAKKLDKELYKVQLELNKQSWKRN